MANSGVTNSDIVQNHFTAYLLVSLNRNNYTFKQRQIYSRNEVALDENIEVEIFFENDLLSELSALDQLDNQVLAKALMNVSPQTCNILFMKVFKELTFPQIAKKLGMNHKNVSAIYYRTIDKLKRVMEEQ